ncbi:MAG: CAP domain-containing protein [Paracoccaceae bacterium]|nr:CAP domain-containing protein [Paracoccaceae bacterium]
MRKILVLALLAVLAACSPPNRSDLPLGTVSRSFPELLNSARAVSGVRGVMEDDRLTRVAQKHADDMAKTGYFSHQSSDGRTLRDRVDAEGFPVCWVAENIAKGQISPKEVIDDWMMSSGHRRNIVWPNASHFGLGHAKDGNYWVLVMAERGC